MELHSFAFNTVSAPEVGSIGKYGVDAYTPTAVDKQSSGNVKTKQSYNGENDLQQKKFFLNTKL